MNIPPAPRPTNRFTLTLGTLLTAAVLLLSPTGSHGAEKSKVLIVDGQNNHDVWPKSTLMMKQYLEDTGLFTVDIALPAERAFHNLVFVSIRATSEIASGSKLGIDATKKLPGEGFIKMDGAVQAKVEKLLGS